MVVNAERLVVVKLGHLLLLNLLVLLVRTHLRAFVFLVLVEEVHHVIVVLLLQIIVHCFAHVVLHVRLAVVWLP